LPGAEGKKEAKRLLNEMKPHLEDGGIGTVSEIFDGDPPHEPRGCIAQAWSVAEILRACVEDLSGL
jgi:glycogen debranching enzyme